MKFVTVCGAGVGSSVMLKVFAQNILSDEGIDGSVEAADISSLNPYDYDVIITSSAFAERLADQVKHLIIMDNMLDQDYLRSQILNLASEEEAVL
ncbi:MULTISPECIES: PTS sugar transporter subunit IIB [Aerococcus]|uniref:PTS sugar transporter subunit IIB n=1 Tax=Aerococcus TaxID=1375 RepID=UPI000DCDB336|nr:PTS sugar transporter subunit IIB [Aerococcus urinae]MDK7302914.1 PTS sugar transporter subunit IIB [Aerococcus urinae]RAV71459.1 PTS lactose transporter subunit IIB [Aerococcus urinae]RAW05184.1 PTS lactose transporter subunit IIB [Aerococcus urinae]